MGRYLDIGRVLTFDQLAELHQHGDFEGVVPYLDPYNPKGATVEYLQDIYRARMRVPGFFYQTTGGAGQGASYFTRQQGRADSQRANELLARFAGLAPAPAIVWYAVDVNVEPTVVDAYATGIEDVANPTLQGPGLYGYQRLMQHARDAYPHIGAHLAQTYGVPSAALELWQHEQVTIDGITVDVDEVYVAGWRPEEGNMNETPKRVGQSADVRIAQGEVTLLQAIFHYPEGRERTIARKFYSHTAGRYIVQIRPPVDPDADLTEHLDAEPAIFVVDVLV